MYRIHAEIFRQKSPLSLFQNSCTHQLTDCFVVSQRFNVARRNRYFKLRSKPRRLYGNRLSYTRAIVILSLSEGIFYVYDSGDLASVPGCVIPKTLKMVLNASLLNTQQCKVRIKGKVEQYKERSCTLIILQCSSYWKGSLLVALYYDRQLIYLKKNLPSLSLCI